MLERDMFLTRLRGSTKVPCCRLCRFDSYLHMLCTWCHCKGGLGGFPYSLRNLRALLQETNRMSSVRKDIGSSSVLVGKRCRYCGCFCRACMRYLYMG